jgi:predicted RNA methylase
VESLITAAANLPHKAFIYGALFALIAQKAEVSLVTDVVIRGLEALQTHLVEEKNVHAAKNVLRFLSIAYDFGIIKAKPYSQTLI